MAVRFQCQFEHEGVRIFWSALSKKCSNRLACMPNFMQFGQSWKFSKFLAVGFSFWGFDQNYQLDTSSYVSATAHIAHILYISLYSVSGWPLVLVKILNLLLDHTTTSTTSPHSEESKKPGASPPRCEKHWAGARQEPASNSTPLLLLVVVVAAAAQHLYSILKPHTTHHHKQQAHKVQNTS